VGAPGVGEVDRKARRLFRYGLPSVSLRYSFWFLVHRKLIPNPLAGMPVKAALLLNYDPTGPSRLLPIM
jgi:hypothetical protein